MSQMADVTNRMVGGTHYAEMGMSPFEFCHRNAWDNTSFSILKYLSRYRRKAGLVDLEKARHIVDIRLALLQQFVGGYRGIRPAVTMGEFIYANDINVEDGTALHALDSWVRGTGSAAVVATTIEFLIEQQKALALRA